MPQTLNLSRQMQGINPNVVSARVWLYSAPLDFTQTGAMPGGEVTPAVARFVVYEGFDARNANGASVGRGSIDTGAQSALEYYNATTLDELLIKVFGAAD